jgi:predicted RND superfamily exporter protein
VVALDESQDAHSTGVMRQIHDLQTGVTRRVDGVGDSFSYVDAAFANELVAQYAPGTDISGIEPQRWIDNSGTRVRVTWVVPMSSAGELEVLTNKVLDAGRELLPRGASLTATGYLPLYSRLIDHVISDQVKSLAVALIVVFGLIACWFRDLRTVLIALAINLPPIVFLLGTMALLNVPLDVATITVAPAMLGLIVDDSMHLLYHYRQRISEGVKLEAALAANFATVGRTLILTSAVLVAGFGLLGFSSVSSISSNGLLMALTVVFALAVDLLLLPPITALLQTAPRGVSAVRHA